MEPWNKIIIDIWSWLTKGWRRYITIPVFVLGFTIPLFFNDSYIKLYSAINDFLSTKVSYPSKDEIDVLNEWIVLISVFDEKSEAQIEYEKFKKVYTQSNHDVWGNDIFLVRNPTKQGEWFITIDVYPGQSTKDDVQGSIENMWKYCQLTRDLENTLGHWLNGARPIFYDSTKFVNTYGKIYEPITDKIGR